MRVFPTNPRELPHERPLLTLVLTVIVVEFIGASGSVFTLQGLDDWYRTLTRPALAPPDWVFGPVWTVLFGLKGVALWLVWRRAIEVPRAVRIASALFGLQFAFNIAWSASFFGQESIEGGLVVIVVLWGSIVMTIWAFDRVDRRAAILLVPYLLWVFFAAFLNYQFWLLN